MVSGFRGTVAVTAPFVNDRNTVDAVAALGVPAPITTSTSVAVLMVQDAALVPETALADAPTLAVHTNPVAMKLVPVTVMVLPTYADVGDTAVAVGRSNISSGVPVTVAVPLCTVISTDDATLGVLAPTTTTAELALATLQDAAAMPELGTAPIFALHVGGPLKPVPVIVIVLPTYAARGEIEVAV